MIRFYFDEDSSECALMDALRARGFDVLAPGDSDLVGADDRTQLEWCARHGFVLVTHNVGDFHCLHSEFLRAGKSHGGLILMRQQTLGIGEKLRRLVRLASRRSADQMKNRVEFLSAWN
jgi:hypothetical protein